MKTYQPRHLVLISVLVFMFYPSPVVAAPAQQTDDPVQLCAESYELFMKRKYLEALPLLREGFNGREKANFANSEDLGYCALVLGVLSQSNGNLKEALEAFQVALPIFRASQTHELEGFILTSISEIYYFQGKFTQAMEYSQQALVIVREVGDREGEGVILDNLGTIYKSQGQYAQALDYYQRALTIRREVDDRAGEGVTLNNLGTVYHTQGQYAQALDYYQQALAIERGR